jgi:hypothetical protein
MPPLGDVVDGPGDREPFFLCRSRQDRGKQRKAAKYYFFLFYQDMFTYKTLPDL